MRHCCALSTGACRAMSTLLDMAASVSQPCDKDSADGNIPHFWNPHPLPSFPFTQIDATTEMSPATQTGAANLMRAHLLSGLLEVGMEGYIRRLTGERLGDLAWTHAGRGGVHGHIPSATAYSLCGLMVHAHDSIDDAPRRPPPLHAPLPKQVPLKPSATPMTPGSSCSSCSGSDRGSGAWCGRASPRRAVAWARLRPRGAARHAPRPALGGAVAQSQTGHLLVPPRPSVWTASCTC